MIKSAPQAPLACQWMVIDAHIVASGQVIGVQCQRPRGIDGDHLDPLRIRNGPVKLVRVDLRGGP